MVAEGHSLGRGAGCVIGCRAREQHGSHCTCRFPAHLQAARPADLAEQTRLQTQAFEAINEVWPAAGCPALACRLGALPLCAQLQIISTTLHTPFLPRPPSPQVVRASAADTTPMVVQLIPLVVGKLNVSGCKGSRSAGRGGEQAAAARPGPGQNTLLTGLC